MSSFTSDQPTHATVAADAIAQRAKIFAALADPTRLRVVELLAEQGELSGSEVANALGISLALFCHHSKILAEAGLLQIRKEGQTKFNSLNRDLLEDCFASFKALCQGRSGGEGNRKSRD